MSKLVLVADEAAPSAPAAGQAIYTESGRLKRQSSGGTVRYLDAVSGAGVLTLATDTAITGGGTIALGGYTLTVPATGTAALLATANIFTANQIIAGSATLDQRVVYLKTAGGTSTQPGLHLGGYNAATPSTDRYGFIQSALSNDIAGSTRSLILQPYGGSVLIGTTTDSGQLTVKAASAATIGLVVNTAATPSANIAEYRNNGTAKLKIGTEGIPDFTGTMGNSTKTVGTDAPADWVQIAIGGTTYYLPAYAA